MNELEKLVNEHLQDILITQEFIDYRDDLVEKLNTGGRDEQQMLVSADCVIAEYELIRLGVVQPPLDFSHDVIVDGKRIDIKIAKGKWFTVLPRKFDWYKQCASNNKVDDFAFLAYKRNVSKPFEVGDTISLRFIKQTPVKTVLYNLNKSMYNGYYYPL